MSSYDTSSDVTIGSPLPLPVSVVSEYTNPVNVFGEVDVPFSAETTIVSYTVPSTKSFFLTSIVGWGEYVGEFFVRLDGIQRGGGWTTAAQITLMLVFDDAPIIASSGQLVTVSILHYNPAMKHFKANICGGTN